MYVDLDLDRMGAVPGGLVAFRVQSRFGDSVNEDTGLMLPANTYSYFPLTDPIDDNLPIAITEANYTQFFSEQFGVVAGKITTMGSSNEFAGGEGRDQFMNFQFIFPAVYAQLAPYSTLAVGAVAMPTASLQFTSILMNTTDSSTTSGFDEIGDGTTWSNTLAGQWELGGNAGGGTLGFLYGFGGDFAKVGGLNIDPGAGGVSIDRESQSWALRFDGWQYLFTESEPGTPVDPTDGRQNLQGLGVFASLGLGDKDTNPVGWAISVGLSGRGLIPSRDDDTMGLGYFYNALEAPQPILESLINKDSQGVEVYYSIAILPSLDLTADFQWAKSALAPIDDSITLGLRCNVRF